MEIALKENSLKPMNNLSQTIINETNLNSKKVNNENLTSINKMTTSNNINTINEIKNTKRTNNMGENNIENENIRSNKNEIVQKSNLEIEQKQNKFINSTMWKLINTGINTGIRALLPNIIEEQVIEIKDAIIKSGFKEGVKQAVNSAIDLGKSAKGIVTGEFEDISQAHDAIKTGGIVDSVSNALSFAINKGVDNKLIPKETGKVLNSGKEIILNTIESNIESNFTKQLKAVSFLGKYEENWKGYYKNRDVEGMEREYKKIRETVNKILPTRNTIIQAEQIMNIHNLIKNKNFKFENFENEMGLQMN